MTSYDIFLDIVVDLRNERLYLRQQATPNESIRAGLVVVITSAEFPHLARCKRDQSFWDPSLFIAFYRNSRLADLKTLAGIFSRSPWLHRPMSFMTMILGRIRSHPHCQGLARCDLDQRIRVLLLEQNCSPEELPAHCCTPCQRRALFVVLY